MVIVRYSPRPAPLSMKMPAELLVGVFGSFARLKKRRSIGTFAAARILFALSTTVSRKRLGPTVSWLETSEGMTSPGGIGLVPPGHPG